MKKTPETTTIYNVFRNSDSTEGRGVELCVGSFEDEDEAWAFADTLSGVMGAKPLSGSWRTERFPEVKVKRQNVVKKRAKNVYEFHYAVTTNPTTLTETDVISVLNAWIRQLHGTTHSGVTFTVSELP